MAVDRNDTKTQDLEHNNTDRAIRAVRDFQKGAATTSFVRNALRAVPDEDLRVVAIATRLPIASLESLRTKA